MIGSYLSSNEQQMLNIRMDCTIDMKSKLFVDLVLLYMSIFGDDWQSPTQQNTHYEINIGHVKCVWQNDCIC